MAENTTISLCMIVRDEEQVLGRCLESVKDFVDEIVILDTGSIDKTKDIATKYNAKIYDFIWCDDFAKARNECFSKATSDYILWLDADDHITEENLNKLMGLKEDLTANIDGVSMLYSLVRDEWENTTYSLRRNRIVKREKGFKWIGRVHEYLEVYGNVIHTDIFVHHAKEKTYSNRNLEIFKNMEKNNEEFTERDLYYFANELFDNAFYEEAIEKYEKFLASPKGWVEDKKNATAHLITCYANTNANEKIINAVLNTFTYDKPRADLCCKVGEYFIQRANYDAAIFWYKAALKCAPHKNYFGTNLREYYTWIPSIQICLCYSILGDYESAYYYNELSRIYGGETDKVNHNRVYLNEMLKSKNLSIPDLEVTLKKVELLS